jgi:hypothetical protein
MTTPKNLTNANARKHLCNCSEKVLSFFPSLNTQQSPKFSLESDGSASPGLFDTLHAEMMVDVAETTTTTTRFSRSCSHTSASSFLASCTNVGGSQWRERFHSR